MPRRVAYGIGVWVTIASTALTIASIVMPNWVRWESTTEVGDHVTYTYGLHSRCSSITGECTHFPQYEDCRGDDRSFCSMWRSVGFLMSFAVIIELATLIAFVVIILGDKTKRDYGWKMVSGLMGLAAVCECAGMGIVAFLYDNDDRFFIGWHLDISWVFCTISWAALILGAGAIAAATIFLPEEGSYDMIPNENTPLSPSSHPYYA